MVEQRHLREAIAGIAAGGVLLGHWVTYQLVSPEPHARAALLATTGHGYLAIANDTGMMIAVGTLAAVALGRIMRPSEAPADLWTLFMRLAWIQVGAFAAMELLEHLASGAPLGELLRGGPMPLGAAIQLGVAALGALAIHWLLRATTRVHEMFGRPAPIPPHSRLALLAYPVNGLAMNGPTAVAGIRRPPPPPR